MDTVKSLLDFLNSYPLWAKLLAFSGVLVTAGVLIFAPRTNKSAENTEDQSSGTFLTVRGIELYPESPDAEIQVVILVNGTKYQYPSVAGVKWLKIGSTMSPGTFKLPNSQIYEVRFEANLRKYEATYVASQRVVRVSKLPYSDEYELYKVNEEMTRSASVSATVRYSIEKVP